MAKLTNDSKKTIDELTREKDFFKLKCDNLHHRIKQLEYDCAELQRRESDLNQRLKELSHQKVMAYRQSNHNHRRNFVKR